MNPSSRAYLPDGIGQAIRGFLAACSQWMSDARLLLAHRRDLDSFGQSANFETLLESLAMTERTRPTGAPAFVAATLLPGVVRRLGRDMRTGEATKLEHDCEVCAHWRTCRAWSQGSGNDSDYRSFCPNAAALDVLPRRVRAA